MRDASSCSYTVSQLSTTPSCGLKVRNVIFADGQDVQVSGHNPRDEYKKSREEIEDIAYRAYEFQDKSGSLTSLCPGVSSYLSANIPAMLEVLKIEIEDEIEYGCGLIRRHC